MIKTDVRDLIQRLYQTAREAHPESQEVFKHICWEAADLIDSFDQRVADLEDEVGDLESKYFTLNQLYNELQASKSLENREMTDYSDLVQRLRGKKLNCTCAATSASECCCNTDWPESSCNEAAEAIEVLERDIVLVTDAMVALTDRVHELKAALKPFEEELKNQELEVPHVIDGDSLIHNYGLRLRDLRSVRAALEKKND